MKQTKSDETSVFTPTMTVESRQRTFLFTDIERSIQAWDADPARMLWTLDAQQDILVKAASRHHGSFIGDGGDGWNLVFESAIDAVQAAVEAQRGFERLRSGPAGKVRVRIGIHTGTPVFSAAGALRGPPLNLAGRLHKAAHGGQVVVSESTQAAAVDGLPSSISLVLLGEYQLRDLPMAKYYQVHARGLQTTFAPLVAASALTGRLVAPSTNLLGREIDISRLAHEADPGLLTLVGLGGVGKTRLAIALAGEIATEFPDGVRGCDLSVTKSDGAVAEIVADALGIEPGSNTVNRIAESLAPKRLVLLLDNCEHVAAGAADVASTVIRNCPHVLVLATSRLPLGVPGERQFPVEPLSLDRPDHEDEPVAVRLFVQRALTASPSWLPDSIELDAVQSLCHRLDGLPLGIEIAAAQMRYLSAVELDEQLADGLGLIDAHSATGSLFAVLSWSYEQLNQQSQETLRQLAVFNGGFTLAAAEAVLVVTDVDRPLLTRLADLVDRALVLVERLETGGSRYHLLETIRAFCRSSSADSMQNGLAQRHADYYLDLAERTTPRLRTEEESAAVALLDSEFANLREAHATFVADRNYESAARLVLALSDFCFVRLRYELYQWAERTLSINNSPDQLLPEIYGIAATGAFLRGDLTESERLARLGLSTEVAGAESFHIRFMLMVSTAYTGQEIEAQAWASATIDWCNHRAMSYYRTVALVASSMGLSLQGESEFALTVANMAFDEATLSGNPTCISWALYCRADALGDTDQEQAMRLLTTSVEIARQVQGSFIVGFAVGAQAVIHRRQGKVMAAAAELLDLLDHWGRSGHLPQQWLTLREAELLLAQSNCYEEAATISGALPRGVVLPPTEDERLAIDNCEAKIETALGQTRRLELAANGATMSLARITQYARDALRSVASPVA